MSKIPPQAYGLKTDLCVYLFVFLHTHGVPLWVVGFGFFAWGMITSRWFPLICAVRIVFRCGALKKIYWQSATILWFQKVSVFLFALALLSPEKWLVKTAGRFKMAMCFSPHRHDGVWKLLSFQRSQSNCLAKPLRRLNWIRFAGDTIGAGRSKKSWASFAGSHWKAPGWNGPNAEMSWLWSSNRRKQVELEFSELPWQHRSRPCWMVAINDFGVTTGNRFKIFVAYAMNTIKTVQMRTCNLVAADVGPGRFPTRREV